MTLPRLLALVPVLLFACSTEGAGDDDGAGTASDESSTGDPGGTEGGGCTPGEVQACLCPDQSGSTQVCLADGSGYSACDCVGDSGADDDSAGTTEASDGAAETSSAGSSDDGAVDGGSDSGTTAGPMPECDGSSHPLVDGDLRYCEPGNCYCGDFSVDPPYDTCYVMEIAEPCCPVEVVCY